MAKTDIQSLLGDEHEYLLAHVCRGIPAQMLRPPGKDDLHQAVRTAVINKRAGGMGLISGRKAFQRPMQEGIDLLNAIQDVYLSPDVTIA